MNEFIAKYIMTAPTLFLLHFQVTGMVGEGGNSMSTTLTVNVARGYDPVNKIIISY